MTTAHTTHQLGGETYNNIGRAIGTCRQCKTVVVSERADWVLGGKGLAKCQNCGAQTGVAAVIGTVKDHVKCDARCLNAKRAQCDCSCGGFNHGAGH
jgi:hypothetical protein